VLNDEAGCAHRLQRFARQVVMLQPQKQRLEQAFPHTDGEHRAAHVFQQHEAPAGPQDARSASATAAIDRSRPNDKYLPQLEIGLRRLLRNC
jgi:hypothetical protein